MRPSTFVSIILALFIMFGDSLSAQDVSIRVFDNLVGKEWKAEKEWENGGKFKQEISFKYSLDSTIVITHSKGFIDEEQKEYGLRSMGIRRVDKETNQIEFVEYDVFGGKTTGTLRVEGQNLYYDYSYNGMQLTDAWEYVNAQKYNFIVGVKEAGEWKQVFLETTFVQKAF